MQAAILPSSLVKALESEHEERMKALKETHEKRVQVLKEEHDEAVRLANCRVDEADQKILAMTVLGLGLKG